MRLATWNINSARARADRILGVLERHNLDVLALQEIKCKPEQFPAAEIEAAGYEVVAHGLNQWNGVAIISRLPISNVRTEFSQQPGFTKGEAAPGCYLPGELEARALGVTVDGGTSGAGALGDVDVWSLYIPNGRALGDPHYFYKLDFLHKLQEFATSELTSTPDKKLALVGDWNVIPTDDDVWDPAALTDGLYLSEAERAAFFAFEDAGLRELSKAFVTNYTYWDYQQLRFPRNEGMRIDYIYASPALSKRAVDGAIDRDERKGKGASDHVPVILEFE